jgi:hypothetical protein
MRYGERPLYIPIEMLLAAIAEHLTGSDRRVLLKISSSRHDMVPLRCGAHQFPERACQYRGLIGTTTNLRIPAATDTGMDAP